MAIGCARVLCAGIDGSSLQRGGGRPYGLVVPDKTGATAEYTLRPAGGSYRPVRITGGCASCGASDATYVHDARGRVIREQGADGYITARTYGAVNPESERRYLKPEGCDPGDDPHQCRLTPNELATAVLQPTSATVTATFRYDDPVWPDRVTSTGIESVLDPARQRTEFVTYDPVTAQVLTRTVRGWTGSLLREESRTTATILYDGVEGAVFAPGGAFAASWQSLPQPRLSKSTDGPRTDVADVVDLVYYPLDSAVPDAWRGRLAAVRNGAGHVERYEDYDELGNPTRIIDANGVVQQRTYDALGRLVTSTIKAVAGCDTAADSLCDTDVIHTRTYAGAGPVRSEERAGGGVTIYEYDSRGRIATVSRGPSAMDLRERLESRYDPLTGRKNFERWLSFADGEWTERRQETSVYDGIGRLSRVVHADETFVTYTYDAASRIASVRDENHTTANTRYEYDAGGRLKEAAQTLASDPNGEVVTRYSYDAHGNLVPTREASDMTISIG